MPVDDDYLVIDDDDNPNWPNLHIDTHRDYPETFAVTAPKADGFIPLCEEAVLACGYVNSKRKLKVGPTLKQAFIGTSRAVQHAWLSTHLPHYANEWHTADRPFEGKQVVKAGASALSRGVEIAHDAEEVPDAVDWAESRAWKSILRLKRAGGVTLPIVEKYLDGPQREVNAVVGCDGNIHLYDVMEQTWSDDGRVIIEYEVVPDEGELAMAKSIIDALGLRGCGFNMETRQGKVIEFQLRLGEDAGFHAAFLEDAMEYLVRWCA